MRCNPGKSALVFLLLCVAIGTSTSFSFGDPVSAQGSVNLVVAQIDKSKFPEITLFVSVTDASGNPVQNLEQAGFSVWEDGKRVDARVPQGSAEGFAITTVMVIDQSGSMVQNEDKLTPAKTAAMTFIDLMQPLDAAGIITFNNRVNSAAQITRDKTALRRAVSGIRAQGGTALFRATVAAVDMLKPAEGRRAIILLTDGIDTEGGPDVDETVEKAVDGDLSIYTIGLGSPGNVDVYTLRELANQTNGRAFSTPSAAELSDVYSLISQQIASEQALTYQSPRPAEDGSRRDVRVQMDLGGISTDGSRSYSVAGVIPPTSIASWGAGSWLLFGGLLLVFAILMAPQGVPSLIRNLERRSTSRT